MPSRRGREGTASPATPTAVRQASPRTPLVPCDSAASLSLSPATTPAGRGASDGRLYGRQDSARASPFSRGSATSRGALSAGHSSSGGRTPPPLLNQASPAQMATTLKLQQSAQRLHATEAQLRSLSSPAPRSGGRGRTPPRPQSPQSFSMAATTLPSSYAPSPGQKHARLKVNAMLHGLKRTQTITGATSTAIELAEFLLKKQTVFPDSKGAQRDLVRTWYKMMATYTRTGANAQAAILGAMIIMADPGSQVCTVNIGVVADHIEAYENNHSDESYQASWEDWAGHYMHTLVATLETMGEDARVNQLRKDLERVQETERENIRKLQAELDSQIAKREQEEAAREAELQALRQAEDEKALLKRQEEAAARAREKNRQEQELQKEIMRLNLHIHAAREAERSAERELVAQEIAAKAMAETNRRRCNVLRRLAGQWAAQRIDQSGQQHRHYLLLKWDALRNELSGEGGGDNYADACMSTHNDDRKFYCSSFLLHQKANGLHLLFEATYPETDEHSARQVGWECLLQKDFTAMVHGSWTQISAWPPPDDPYSADGSTFTAQAVPESEPEPEPGPELAREAALVLQSWWRGHTARQGFADELWFGIHHLASPNLRAGAEAEEKPTTQTQLQGQQPEPEPEREPEPGPGQGQKPDVANPLHTSMQEEESVRSVAAVDGQEPQQEEDRTTTEEGHAAHLHEGDELVDFTGVHRFVRSVASYDAPDAHRHDLAIGDILAMTAQKKNGWCEGFKINDPLHTKLLFPSKFVRVVQPAKSNQQPKRKPELELKPEPEPEPEPEPGPGPGLEADRRANLQEGDEPKQTKTEVEVELKPGLGSVPATKLKPTSDSQRDPEPDLESASGPEQRQQSDVATPIHTSPLDENSVATKREPERVQSTAEVQQLGPHIETATAVDDKNAVEGQAPQQEEAQLASGQIQAAFRGWRVRSELVAEAEALMANAPETVRGLKSNLEQSDVEGEAQTDHVVDSTLLSLEQVRAMVRVQLQLHGFDPNVQDAWIDELFFEFDPDRSGHMDNTQWEQLSKLLDDHVSDYELQAQAQQLDPHVKTATAVDDETAVEGQELQQEEDKMTTEPNHTA